MVTARLQEENQAKTTLAELEAMDLDSSDFERKFSAFQRSVIAHAEAEEREEFERLGSYLDPSRLELLRKAVEVAEQLAPTRPHPGVESAMANLLVGPFAAMIDRARDALAKKS